MKFPVEMKVRLKAIFNEICDGRLEHHDIEYRPRPEGPHRWIISKGGVVLAEVEAASHKDPNTGEIRVQTWVTHYEEEGNGRETDWLDV